MVSGSLALLYFLISFHGRRQGSGPDKGQSPVEWGDFLFVCSSVCPFVCPPPLGHLPRSEAQPARPIRAAALPPPMKTKEKVEQGKGTADHLMPMGYLFI